MKKIGENVRLSWADCECRGCKNLRLEQNENQGEIEVEEDADDEENDEDNDDEEETIETEMVTDDIDELCLSYLRLFSHFSLFLPFGINRHSKCMWSETSGTLTFLQPYIEVNNTKL